MANALLIIGGIAIINGGIFTGALTSGPAACELSYRDEGR